MDLDIAKKAGLARGARAYGAATGPALEVQNGAQEDYKRAFKEAEQLLSAIKAAMRSHESQADLSPKNYGYAGDMNALVEALREAASRIKG